MTPTDLAPSLFDAFNARQMQPHDVAKTFVPPAHYETLAKNRHTILVGPRGSGKTTLLKMLQQPALEAWEHPLASRYRKSINYTGVFVPFDQSWNAQMRSLGSGHLDQEHRQRLSIAAFTTHILKALVTAMHNRCYGSPHAVSHHRRVSLDQSNEARLVSILADAWYLSPIVPSLQSLKHALALRLSRIWEFTLQESGRDDEGRDARFTDMPMLHIHFLQASSHAVEIFNDFVHDDGKWAMLFDELELAPDWVCRELTMSLRSFDERFLFKLSLSPYTAEVLFLDSVSAAMPGHDYDMIPLWHAHKETGFQFCEDLLAAMLARKGQPPTRAESIFGDSLFDSPSGNKSSIRSAYRPTSPRHKTFCNLAMKDRSFRAYLKRKEIDLHRLHEYTEDERAKDIRKIMPLVIIRDAFRTADISSGGSVKQTLRSRKNPRLYTGAKTLFTIVEGNPRWFLGIIAPLINHYTLDRRKVPARLQSEAVAQAAHRFRALLRTIPCPPIDRGVRPRGLLSLLNIIGKYLFDAVVAKEFDPDALGSFSIDSHPTSDLLASLKQAMNSGAIVYVPDEQGLSQVLRPDNLRGKRFRLSYLLAADYCLPVRLGRPIALSAMLQTVPGPLPLFEKETM